MLFFGAFLPVAALTGDLDVPPFTLSPEIFKEASSLNYLLRFDA